MQEEYRIKNKIKKITEYGENAAHKQQPATVIFVLKIQSLQTWMNTEKKSTYFNDKVLWETSSAAH